MENENNQLEVNAVKIGDTYYNEDEISPSVYFDYVKGLKQKLNGDEYDIIIDTTIKMLKKAQITKQTAMCKKLTAELELALKEVDAAKAGFDIYVSRKEIEKYIDAVESKSIKVVELSNYEREIPDSVMDKIEKANEMFDELYIFFTDYTKKETKKVAKHRRDKDPIVFGGFKGTNPDDSVYIEDRLFFVADWVEEKCDLTLEELCRDIKDKSNTDITYKVQTPKDEEEVKKILDSYSKKTMDETDIEPVSLFDKIKNKVRATRKKSTRSTTSKKEKE